MIPAKEALQLPSAKLTDDERIAADKLELDIEVHVRKFMERRGCDFQTNEIRANVVAEVSQRLKAAGYIPQWQASIERHKLNAALSELVGWRLSLAPSDDAYRSV